MAFAVNSSFIFSSCVFLLKVIFFLTSSVLIVSLFLGVLFLTMRTYLPCFTCFFLLSSAVRDDVMEENPAARSSGGPSINMTNSLLLFLLLPGWLKSCRRRTV